MQIVIRYIKRMYLEIYILKYSSVFLLRYKKKGLLIVKRFLQIMILLSCIFLISCGYENVAEERITSKFHTQKLNDTVIKNNIQYRIESGEEGYKICIYDKNRKKEIPGMFRSNRQQILFEDGGYLYYNIGVGEEEKICRFNLKTNKEECVASLQIDLLPMRKLMVRDDIIYYLSTGKVESGQRIKSYILNAYNIKTQEAKQYSYHIYNDYDIVGNHIYYNTIVDQTTDSIPQIIKSDLNNEEEKQIVATTCSSNLCYYNDKLYYIDDMEYGAQSKEYPPSYFLFSVSDGEVKKESSCEVSAYYIVNDIKFIISNGILYKENNGEIEEIFKPVDHSGGFYFSNNKLRFMKLGNLEFIEYAYDLEKKEVTKFDIKQ